MQQLSTFSQAQYMKGLQCPLALWFSVNRKDLDTRVSASAQLSIDIRKEINNLARQYFPDGTAIVPPSQNMKIAIKQTKEKIQSGARVIYGAAATNPRTGTQAHIDILRQVDDTDFWDLIEVKTSANLYDHYIQGMAFQYLVFIEAGYKIRSCILMCINNQYVRQGEIEPQGIFTTHDITSKVLNERKKTESVTDELLQVLNRKHSFSQTIGSHCKKPHECSYKTHCWRHVPEYSIFNVFNSKKAESIAQRINSYKVEDIPNDSIPSKDKIIEISCYKEQRRNVEPVKIKNFLRELKYPLYYLDYETIAPAIPFYDGTNPYQKLPFQFSLHVQKELESEFQHIEFIHKEKSDPRKAFVEYLINVCGNTGSVICYYASFERNINEKLAKDFSEYATQINDINKRIVDLYVPFKNHILYDPRQNGSTSIKKVLPALINNLSYKDLEIADGEQASQAYMKFCKEELSTDELQKLWKRLSVYCELDTYAMVQLLDALRKSSA
ncbi:MAG: hypothetical protein C4617_03240 [Candidatus Liberibacter europaeus]|uniref:DUF2779 domain-containing protein n=1 Tax=Candidatus Liberibacter europaeus TaxID=744859 RepID=A0A2T4VYG5_9HYPH|nr:hypothetical protein [Candidatus Liberibacter europaeus]PTL86822.1 MAG: hypothetical protein C4617_03240 [Candidatus Liberibacter europaeus]